MFELVLNIEEGAWERLNYVMNTHIRFSNNVLSVKDVMKKLQEYVDDINENIQKLETRGPVSKYVLADENLRGRFDTYILHQLAKQFAELNFWFIILFPCVYIHGH